MSTASSLPSVTPGAVWDSLVGQRHVVETLARPSAGQGMTHAWLFTGPPGSGRSNAALAFAAALQCARAAAAECHACQTALAGSHPDVSVTRSETSMLYIEDMRGLVLRSALVPVERRWQVIIVEDADRLDERAQRTRCSRRSRSPPPRRCGCCAPRSPRTCCRRSGRGCRTSPDHPDGRRGRRVPGRHRRRGRPRGCLRRAGQPGPHRPGPGARPRRGDPQPAPRGRGHPRPAHLARRLHDRGGQPRRHRQRRDRGDHRRAATPARSRSSRRSTATTASPSRRAPTAPALARARPTARSSAEAPGDGRHRPRH